MDITPRPGPTFRHSAACRCHHLSAFAFQSLDGPFREFFGEFQGMFRALFRCRIHFLECQSDREIIPCGEPRSPSSAVRSKAPSPHSTACPRGFQRVCEEFKSVFENERVFQSISPLGPWPESSLHGLITCCISLSFEGLGPLPAVREFTTKLRFECSGDYE